MTDIKLNENKTSTTQHDQRLFNIIDQAPMSEKEQTKTFVQKAKKFCCSKIGIALITFVLVFLLLLFLQPMYIFKKNDENSFSIKYINYAIVATISVSSALLVLVIPLFILKNKS